MIKKIASPKKKKKKKKTDPVDDAVLWGHVAATVDPLDPRYKNLLAVASDTEKASPPPASPKKRATTGGTRPAAVPLPTPKRRPVLPELEHGTTAGVDKSTATRLKKGRQPIEARLDLHGMTQAEAHPALDTFIAAACRAGKRNVLVITGKGTKMDGTVGVLRQAVPRWLNLPPNRPRILTFTHATAKDGGEGALYILLKRQR